ncbi:LysR family transcriptional regulator [Neptunomonas phycophila]|uniref:LysR family transcriptional regulator n=1 Tax=Neptunomonas phycophila TaxID=1572645 RepID=UPI0015BAC411|nr:LysR family transcriptional regulator [Neptunomonas phycophila]MBT3146086.1 LysR family transcriptional regulator [Neptunomonas phycophila]MDO6783244.1 LysR family transcriptional regulator [Neptunomonas phycophila]QLE97805.1 LysR family transcriptional regulator [Neptunomonas phycophila]
MNITVKQLRAFVAVAKTRSFTEACSQIHISQPALSVAIKNLEDALGGPLLSRTTRTLALTPEGEAFLPTAQRLLAELDEALEEMHNRFALFRGKVAIAAMPFFASSCLPDVLLKFRAHHPHINLTVHDVIAEDVIDMVRTGRVEVGIAFDPGEAEDLVFQKLYTDRFMAVIPRQHVLNTKAEITGADILPNDFIVLQRPSSVRLLVDARLEQEGLHISPQLETHQLTTIGQMVSKGLGISIMPSLCEAQMLELGAMCKPLSSPVISHDVGIITRRRYPLSTAAREMIINLQGLKLDVLQC